VAGVGAQVVRWFLGWVSEGSWLGELGDLVGLGCWSGCEQFKLTVRNPNRGIPAVPGTRRY
jgi:hypothetical protein